MLTARLDHLVVAARSLNEGVAWVQDRLGGIRPHPGGGHPRMGTHNHVLKLGETTYLEVIAIDPAATPPPRPRWFGLDDAAMHTRLSERPRLVGWAAAVTDIGRAIAACPVHVGIAEAMSRGSLEWLIAIPSDGSLPEQGVMPTLIEWPADRPHPAAAMPQTGCRLARLDLHHPDPGRLRVAFDAIGLDRAQPVHLGPGSAGLCASIRTPTGLVALES